MNRTAVPITLAVMLVLVVAATQVWASEGHAEGGVPADISMTNPQQMTPESLKTGMARYEKNCAGCHGETGKGDGPLADALPEKPTDFTNVTMMEEHTDGELFFKIKKGVGEYMPGYEDQLPDEDMWHLVNYLRSTAASEGAGETPKMVATGKETIPKVQPEEFRALENPVLNDHVSFTGGKEVYKLYCFRCHGENGWGNNGSYAQSVLTEPAPDLSDPALLSKRTDGELFYIIKFGSKEMPSYEEYLHDEEIWQTINYIRTFEGQEHDTTTQEKSNTTLYGAILLIAVLLIVYAVKRR